MFFAAKAIFRVKVIDQNFQDLPDAEDLDVELSIRVVDHP